MARRRQFNVFSLSFLDIMSCGFGAVILIFIVITATMSERAETVLKDLNGEAARLEIKVLTGRNNLVQLRNRLAELITQEAVTKGLSRELIEQILKSEIELARLQNETLARTESVEALEAELEALEKESRRLSAASVTPEEAGDRIRSFTGQGDRQYLTGLKMGGQRILVLVDRSASMLDRTIVNVIRRRNMSDAQKSQSKKWRQTVATLDWLTTQFPLSSQFQIYRFNTVAEPLVEDSDGEWLDVSDGTKLNDAVQGLRTTVPEGGTSLHVAFDVINAMQPKPDNVFLMVDGLPTQGATIPRRKTVSGKERVRHYERAIREIPRGIPINVILYPMEGDPGAAPAFWQLATRSGGSFMSPSEDWP